MALKYESLLQYLQEKLNVTMSNDAADMQKQIDKYIASVTDKEHAVIERSQIIEYLIIFEQNIRIEELKICSMELKRL